MWDHKKSLRLSQVVTALVALAVVAALAGGPWLVNELISVSPSVSLSQFWLFIATLYSGGVLALAMLLFLFLVLCNLAQGQVFEQKNVRLLRGLSWCCFLGAAISAVSGLYYLPWLVVALAAGFVGLIVRVVKNMLAEAIVLKEENDLTV